MTYDFLCHYPLLILRGWQPHNLIFANKRSCIHVMVSLVQCSPLWDNIDHEMGWSRKIYIFQLSMVLYCKTSQMQRLVVFSPFSVLLILTFLQVLPSTFWYKWHLSMHHTWWSLRCSWSIACQRCSNHIFILDLTPGFNGLGKGNGKTRRQTFKFCDSVRLILEICR